MRSKIQCVLCLAVLAGLVLLAGCSRQSTEPEPGVPGAPRAKVGPIAAPAGTGPAATEELTGELSLFIPCGMLIPMKAALDEFAAAHPNLKLKPEYDNAMVLVKRVLERNEKTDVFVSPGSTEVEKLEARGITDPAAKKPVGSFDLVAVARHDYSVDIEAPEDLLKCKTISIPDPRDNSVGACAKEALTNLGLWESLEPKLFLTEQPIDSHHAVTGGKADVGIAYNACPLETNPEKMSESDVRICFAFPPDSYKRQHVWVVPTVEARNRAAAEAVVAFLASPEGLKILEDNHLTGASTPAAGAAESAESEVAVSGQDAAVTVVAFYPDNESHQEVKQVVLGLADRYKGKVKVEFVDFSKDPGFTRWQDAGLSCGAILINDRATWSYEAGGTAKQVTFKRHMGGEWSEEDLYAVIEKILQDESR